MQWRLVQLADSGFPAGGFAHSGGLEAAVALGHARGESAVIGFATAALWQAGTFALPYVREAYDGREAAAFAALDERCDRAQSGHVTRRASRAQGRAWTRACVEAFAIDAPPLPLGHLPVAFGASLSALGIERDDALALYLQIVTRGVLSAAVRLGEMGPNAAQVEELYANLHDALPARLFQS
jgi:urease accessory protein